MRKWDDHEDKKASSSVKLAVFAGVREFPVRVKCGNLGWHKLRATLKGYRGGIDRMTGDALRQQIIQVLRGIYDPEIPVNIYELGLIYGVTIDDAGVVFIRMTLTSPNCPVAGSLPPEVESKAKAVAGVTEVRIDLVFDPPWTKDMMSEAAKLALGIEDVIPVARILHP